MIEGIEWLGHDSFRVSGSTIVYVDPWKLSPKAAPADVVLVTHDHYDHFSPEDIAIISRPTTVIVGPPAVARKYGARGRAVSAGDSVAVAGVAVTAVLAYNLNKFRQPGEVYHPRGLGVGFVFELDGRRIYHAGDTDAIPEMAGIEVDVALLPVSGVYVMTADEAAAACRGIRAEVVVPMHWGVVAGSREDADRFAVICPYPVEIMTPVR